MWSLALSREGFDGVQHGVDRPATQVLQRKLRGLDKYRLRCLQAGAVSTGKRLFRAGLIDCPNCQLCNTGAVETMAHLADDCPALDHVRYRELRPTAWHTLTDALRLHGIFSQAQLPPGSEYDHADWQKDLTARVQYTLLDMLAFRQEAFPDSLPRPRW